MKIFIVGNSPLSFFITRALDQSLARHAHVSVHYITADKELYYLPHLKFFKPLKTVNKKKSLPHSLVTYDRIKSVSLKSRRIVTEATVYTYDLIVFDQTPWYSLSELKEMEKSLQTLLLQLRTNAEQQAAAVRLAAEGVSAWQVAASIKQWLLEAKNGSIRVEVEKIKDQLVESFLREAGVALSQSTLAGFHIAAPQPLISTSLIKGLPIDAKGRAIIDAHGLVKGSKNVLVIDSSTRTLRNLYRAEKTLADEIKQQIVALESGQAPKVLQRQLAAFLLRSRRDLVLQFGPTKSSRFRAKITAHLDEKFWQSLSAR